MVPVVSWYWKEKWVCGWAIFGFRKKGFKMVLLVDLYLNISNAYKMTTTHKLKKFVKIANWKIFLCIIFHILNVTVIRKQTLANCINFTGAKPSI